jgi:hypothetical protein
LKWYQKALYRAAMAILPPSVKRQMLGVGRMTVPKNANPWNWFNWLPKKYQTAHNIDLTKLQSYTAEELLELLVSVHPDVSHALHTYLRMGDTDLTFSAVDGNGKPDASGQKVVDEIKAMLNQPLDSPGYQHGRSLDKLDAIQRLMVMVRGACAGEVVLNDKCNDVVDIVPVDPSLIWFRRDPDTNRLVPWQFVRFPKMKPGEEWFGQYKKIDTPTFIYEELDPIVDDPYGRSPILPVLQVVFFHLQVLQDLKAVVHNQGYPRMDVTILEEIILKNMPAQFKNDPNAQRQWLAQRLADYQNQFNSLNPDDALIHWDSVEVKYIDGSGKGPMIDVKKLIDVIDTQLATSLKTLLTLLSRHQGSTETYSSVDVQLYIKTVESARNVTRRFWERAFSLAARVKGVQTHVKAEYAPIDLRSENELETDRQLRLENLTLAERNFFITSEEAAQESRKALGLDPKIPAELKDKLKNKSEPPPAPEPSPEPTGGEPAANRRFRMSAAAAEEDDEDDESDGEEKAKSAFILLFLALMGHLRDQIRHATSLSAIPAALSITHGVASQLQRGLFQLYRDVYVSTYNGRARDSDSGSIRNPDTQTAFELRSLANQVMDGINRTYKEEMQSAFRRAVVETKDLPPDEQLARVKQIMTEWANERMQYKAEQIAAHEATIAYHRALFDHDEEHAPDTMYDVQPTDTLHEACAEIIAGAPYSLDEARSITLPLHPNCPHRLVPVRI